MIATTALYTPLPRTKTNRYSPAFVTLKTTLRASDPCAKIFVQDEVELSKYTSHESSKLRDIVYEPLFKTYQPEIVIQLLFSP